MKPIDYFSALNLPKNPMLAAASDVGIAYADAVRLNVEQGTATAARIAALPADANWMQAAAAEVTSFQNDAVARLVKAQNKATGIFTGQLYNAKDSSIC